MEEKWGWPGALGAGIVVSIFALVTISAAGAWPWFFDVNGSTWAAWAQAIGSFAAVSVALVLAGRESRLKHQIASVRAGLVAARLSGVIEEMLEALSTTSATLVFAEHPAAEDIAYLCRAMASVKSVLGKIPTNDLGDLVPLPNQAAHRLARAVAILEGLANEIQHETEGTAWFQFTTVRRLSLMKSWAMRLARGTELLRISKVELDRAAENGAPAPTAEELHGNFDPSEEY